MPRHTTTDPAIRAWHAARTEQDRQYRSDGDSDRYFKEVGARYAQYLAERQDVVCPQHCTGKDESMKDLELHTGVTVGAHENLRCVGIEPSGGIYPAHTIHTGDHSHAVVVFGAVELRDQIIACVNAMPKVELLLRLIGTDNPEGLQDMRNLRDEIRAILDAAVAQEPQEGTSPIAGNTIDHDALAQRYADEYQRRHKPPGTVSDTMSIDFGHPPKED